jgi:hypothetical protein
MLVRVFQVRSDERDYVLKTLNKTRLRCERTLNGGCRSDDLVFTTCWGLPAC